MKIVEQSWKWLQKPRLLLEVIEEAGRTCYKSESQITEDSSRKFVESLIKRGHESVIEHVSASVRFITNRGVTHELVRHRLCSFSQESTRYVKYDGDMEFIKPVWFNLVNSTWADAMRGAEQYYKSLLDLGWRPEQAREVLPNSLKTEIVVTANLREWKHIFNLRCAKAAHPQIRALMISCRRGFRESIPIIFDEVVE
jgi:thymidylate synthase (FAD)